MDARTMTEDEYADWIDEIYGDIKVCGVDYPASQVLQMVDPMRFNHGCCNSDIWICDNCNKQFDYEEEAEECCSELVCEVCGNVHQTKEEAEECCKEKFDCDCGLAYDTQEEADKCAAEHRYTCVSCGTGHSSLEHAKCCCEI